ncbi:surfeit locus protein 6 homolog [Copidosoma floridanum]|uniref:surfeit locus protein 6 homolog n=1 Tax=Copidosoma floridanum TaxID=29053 RepID=UPI0006C9A3A4|nr:surfeit locus protein 6 homolog [Copidosoma floridanum]
MKLKMEKPFNKKLTRKLLVEEDGFISKVFAGMPLPAQEIVALNHESFLQYRNKFQRKEFGEPHKKAKNFEELQAKIDELKGKKLNYKEKLMKKGLKNRIQKKAKKDQRQKDKQRARLEQKSVQASQAQGKEDDEGEDEKPKISKPQKPIFNSQGHMVFSKFDFSDIGTKKKPVKTEKDPKKLLEHLTEKKKKLKELIQSGDKEKALEIKEKDAWKAALAKSTGEKVKDDPELLKRTIKREEQRKLKSKRKWEARNEKTQAGIQERQQKRSENIMKRKKDVKKNKLKKASKKGRIIPGF